MKMLIKINLKLILQIKSIKIKKDYSSNLVFSIVTVDCWSMKYCNNLTDKCAKILNEDSNGNSFEK